MKAFRGLGFNLFEGYGLTEASPVLTVNRPGTRLLPGTVGEPLPGIDVRIDDPDARGVGEVVAIGPQRDARLLREPRRDRRGHRKDGWLHTGDLGRFDDDGRLYIVGRKKEMILGPSGENVYPDELEELYRDSPYIKELSIVGLPADSGGRDGGDAGRARLRGGAARSSSARWCASGSPSTSRACRRSCRSTSASRCCT